MEQGVESINPSEYGPILFNKITKLTQYGFVNRAEVDPELVKIRATGVFAEDTYIYHVPPSIYAEYTLQDGTNVACTKALDAPSPYLTGGASRNYIEILFPATIEGKFTFDRSLEIFINEGRPEIGEVRRRTTIRNISGEIVPDPLLESRGIRLMWGEQAWMDTFISGELGRKHSEVTEWQDRPLEPVEFIEILRVLEQLDPKEARPPEYITV